MAVTPPILDQIAFAKARGEKCFAVLIDPDSFKLNQLSGIIDLAKESKVDFFFIGGSLMTDDRVDECLVFIRERCNIPTILFPGSPLQISDSADALLFLSLISGRNADLLIGQHVTAAPYLRKTNLEILPTGYMLIDSGRPTTANYISHTLPIPADKPDIAAATALAGQYLGLRLMYLDGGSGAQQPITAAMIKRVAETVDTPIIVGGGIRSAEQASAAANAGADVIVVGNRIEQHPTAMLEIAKAIRKFSEPIAQ